MVTSYFAQTDPEIQQALCTSASGTWGANCCNTTSTTLPVYVPRCAGAAVAPAAPPVPTPVAAPPPAGTGVCAGKTGKPCTCATCCNGDGCSGTYVDQPAKKDPKQCSCKCPDDACGGGAADDEEEEEEDDDGDGDGNGGDGNGGDGNGNGDHGESASEYDEDSAAGKATSDRVNKMTSGSNKIVRGSVFARRIYAAKMARHRTRMFPEGLRISSSN